MTRTRWTSTITLLVLVLGAGCTDGGSTELPARVAPVPAEVRGLGPAVLAVPVPADRGSRPTGLIAVDRFGDDLSGLAPVRRHVSVAFGDPRYPTIARGMGDDRRDAFLLDGRLRDVTLPDRASAGRAIGVSATLSITSSRCFTVTGDGTIAQPAVESSCRAADRGGVVWRDRSGDRYGGIDLTNGTASPAMALPSYPIAASPDGRYLAAVTTERPRRLVIGDTATGRWRPTVTVSDRNVPGVFTRDGFAVLHRTGGLRAVSLVTPDGDVRDLLAPVGEVAFAPDGRRAIVVDTRSGTGRLAVLDLRSSAVTPVVHATDADGGQPGGPAELPPVTGAVTAVISGDTALVVQLSSGPDTTHLDVRPSRAWTVRLSEATATLRPDTPEASAVTVRRPDGLAEVEAAATPSAVPTLSFQPGGETVTLSADGTVTTAPPGANPRGTLGHGVVLYTLIDREGRERADRLLVADGSGTRTEIPTGAGRDQRVDRVILTPDRAHLVISLRSIPVKQSPGELDAVVVARCDGTGEPVVVYRGAVLVSLGVAPAGGP